ncbi:Rap1a/Tai family immunity protein [Benzoatithermus flavus]|uniref:Rap1a/Tai family immunity protein n=1 Tax=Benzoatithermus flavus TaxID=3108223 RepID=A0ABU8XUD2_9PROT
MVRAIFLLTLTATFLAPPVPARAAFLTGAELLGACTDQDPNGYGQIYCLAYVTGIADVLEQNAVNGLRACIPEEATVATLAGIVRESLARHPERGGYGAAGLVADALGSTFPCR